MSHLVYRNSGRKLPLFHERESLRAKLACNYAQPL